MYFVSRTPELGSRDTFEGAQNEKCKRAPIWPTSPAPTTFPSKRRVVNSMTKAFLRGETD